MNTNKKLEACTIQQKNRYKHEKIANKHSEHYAIQMPYIPPTIICLESINIAGGQVSNVLEASSGLLTS